MDPILSEIYSTVLEAAPFVIAAYALIWLVLLVYVIIIVSRLKNTEKRMTLLEDLLVADLAADRANKQDSRD
ncbi:MAG: CcmD family protein [Coriobacteriia bacterium]|nr:CcmD family protein [Coriobacteriia bacterium]